MNQKNATSTHGTEQESANLANYDQRISALQREVDRIQSRDADFTRARGAILLLLVACLVMAFVGVGPRGLWLAGAGLAFLVIVVVAGFHEYLLERLNVAKVRAKLQRAQRSRYARDWNGVPVAEVALPPQHRGISQDLDLFGAESVYQFVCRAHTPAGRNLLRDWLLTPAGPDEIPLRQEAVQRLSREAALRNELELHGRMLLASETGPDALIEWAESEPVYTRQPIRRWLIRTLTLAMIVVPSAIFAGWISADWALLVYASVGINVIVNGLFVGRVHDLFNAITAGKNELVHYAALFEMIHALPEEGAKLIELRNRLRKGGTDFRTALARLKRIMKWGSGRRSSIFGVPYVFAQILWYWDFHVLERLERWQAQYGSAVRHWFASVGELEAVCSLATVAADHPDWCFPEVVAGADCLTALALGHPLLPIATCQPNDVTVGPPGSFLLVTGSNMSGKSTLLRAIGVNAVLAQTGGPACAQHLRLPIVELATSMRVTDSLADGVSFFMAELKRLKEIVDRAAKAEASSDKRLLYLLDEILQGTNSAERHIAVARVIGFLLDSSAIGAVSTHDLELATVANLKQRCHTVHFREHFSDVGGQRQMTFDYLLRDGVSPTTNALKLLELVGLDE